MRACNRSSARGDDCCVGTHRSHHPRSFLPDKAILYRGEAEALIGQGLENQWKLLALWRSRTKGKKPALPGSCVGESCPSLRWNRRRDRAGSVGEGLEVLGGRARSVPRASSAGDLRGLGRPRAGSAYPSHHVLASSRPSRDAPPPASRVWVPDPHESLKNRETKKLGVGQDADWGVNTNFFGG